MRRSTLVMSAVLSCLPARSLASQELPFADDLFLQETRHEFIPNDAAARDIRAIAIDGQQRAWIATVAGLRVLREDRWQPPEGTAIDGPVFALATDAQGVLWIGAWNGLHRVDDTSVTPVPAITAPIGTLWSRGDQLLAAGPDGIWQRTGALWAQLTGDWASSIRALALDDTHLWVGTGIGLYRVANGQTTRLYREAELVTADVRGLGLDARGRLWVASTGGLDLFTDGRHSCRYTTNDGLPCSAVRGVTLGPDGRAWIGTELGVARFDGDRWSLRHSRRWLPHDEVRDVAFDAEGRAWIATAGGVSRITAQPMTLANKADHLQRAVRARHVRPPGLVERCNLTRAGDLTSFAPRDTDNDGLFTGLYLAAESFRYAATRAPDAQSNAREAYRGMEFLQTVTGTEGFVARTVVPTSWSHKADPNRTFTPQQIAEARIENPRWKRIEKRWRRSADGQWLWKGDTSSDEISGHFFAYGAYFDLAADTDERQRVAAHVRRIIDHIERGGWVLRDVDGEATRWAVWSPEKLGKDPNWRPERNVNALEILSFLNVARHVTGDDRYHRLAGTLLTEHGYADWLLEPQPTDPNSFTYIDAQLLALAYRGLITYETDAKRKTLYLRSLERWFEIVRHAHSPLYDFIVGAARGGAFDLDIALDYLRAVPLDMVQWTVDQRAREDVRLVRRPQSDAWQVDRLLPPDERAVHRWDRNPFQAVRGEDGGVEGSGVFWLLPYWMARHHGFLAGG